MKDTGAPLPEPGSKRVQPLQAYVLGLAALVLAVSIWGASFPIIDAGLGQSSVQDFLFLRFSVGAVLITCIVIIRGFQLRVWRHPGGWILGGLLYLSFVLQTEGLRLTTPAHSAFLTSLSVLFVPLISSLALKNSITRGFWGAIAISLVGILVLYGQSFDQFSEGDVFSVLCALGFALHLLVAERVVRQQDVLNVTAVQVITVAILSGVVSITRGTIFNLHLSVAFTTSVIFAGILATVVAFGAQLFAQKRIDAVGTALVLSLEPVIAGVLSVMAGRDSLGFPLAMGGTLLFIGAALGQLTSLRQGQG